MSQEYKLVIRGLPFESTEKHVTEFFGVDEDAISMPKWADSGRSKGVAFISVYSESEYQSLKDKSGESFTVEDNTREISVVDYEERPPRNNRRGGRGGRRGGRRGGNRGGDRQKPEYDEDEESQREVYVSNIPYSAEEADFERVFKDCGVIEEITIPTIYTSGRPKGFAFVRFTTLEGRDNALALNGTIMVDRELGVRPNKGRAKPVQKEPREPRSHELSEKPAGCTTIFVGNLPWSADEAELADEFAKFGEIQSTRIVRQSWTKKSRGFGYVVFQNEDSVDQAVNANVNIGGRDIRIDYAEQLDN